MKMKKILFAVVLSVKFFASANAADNSASAQYTDKDGFPQNACYQQLMYKWFIYEAGKKDLGLANSMPSINDTSVTKDSNNLVKAGLITETQSSLAKKVALSSLWAEASTHTKLGDYPSWFDKTIIGGLKTTLPICGQAFRKLAN